MKKKASIMNAFILLYQRPSKLREPKKNKVRINTLVEKGTLFLHLNYVYTQGTE